MAKNQFGLDRKIIQTQQSIQIIQWNQVLIRAERLAPNRIAVTKSIETLHPSDFVTLANWAYQIEPDTPPSDQATTES